ncbi:MAG: tRNA guanosine(15) transglycosylase TgtA [Nitrososphaerota archaeon]|nr:tRNA guanosine(15) transglycosylase TgtA [Candidatus Bathyarchaeota archaeon]MDW8194209.1 tRNA guanosine(15) transglycosylase TgtA [Nitrososphaerota archaeon]
MSFEVKDVDLLGRIGKLRTKSGTVETPMLFPVINPNLQFISPKEIRRNFGFEALITNAYILRRRFQDQPAEKGIHDFLDFDGIVMTDSGAYQILVYGGVEVTPEEIVKYQERIGVDIATILDWPTGWNVNRSHAEYTVEETLGRAKDFFKIRTRDDIIWVGPVQGGRFLDLVARSAAEMGKLPFQIHALGSPTEVMERYRFDVLVDMIMTAKMNLPISRPLHLFGAGHPFMFSLAVALGCDMFDSAAYAIYARDGRYMTEGGTIRLEELEYFPCSCPECWNKTPKDVVEKPKDEQQIFLARHNLHACNAEIKRIKQAIKEGRLWEHLQTRAHGHPSLLQALKKLRKYENFIEKHSPIVKRSGLFFYSSLDLARPEVVRYKKRIDERYTQPRGARVLLLIPQTRNKPFHNTETYKRAVRALRESLGDYAEKVHICFYAAPFGIVPEELDEVYPMSQNECTLPPDRETAEYVASQVAEYISRASYDIVLFINDYDNWGDTVLEASRKACLKRGARFKYYSDKEMWIKAMSVFLKRAMLKGLGDSS